ncbi:Nucleolin 1 [Cardamine amara subsp. amara]|uniref:Nucleolin 1 n=1 Tax=Cardamine amara subsp. amara TaxID=228776 RepID=A0ABD1C0X1_CARAN
MAESATKVIDPSKTYLLKDRVIRDISVEGFDDTCSLQNYALGLALIKHFGSCGNILSVNLIKSVAFIRLEGEGAQEKALLLDGTDVGGWKAIVKAAVRPLVFNFPCDANAMIKSSVVFAKGYDTGLAEIDIKIALCNHFSSCGEVTKVAVIPSEAIITIRGEGCVEKALELNGSVMGGMNLVVDSGKRQTEVPENRRLYDDNTCGYVLGSYSRLMAKRRKEEMVKERKTGREMKRGGEDEGDDGEEEGEGEGDEEGGEEGGENEGE